MSKLKNISKFISFVLRHDPGKFKLNIDREGWVFVSDLIAVIQKKNSWFCLSDLREIVSTDDKGRYSFSEDGKMIRAVQGHSIESVDKVGSVQIPPEFLFHGTAIEFLPSIKKSGILPKSRNQVHLSCETETALKVGSRHGTPVVLKVYSREMHHNGYVFNEADNGVWLTDQVPESFFEVIA